MIIEGETYACESCIRGHRSRNCQHNDRPLQHIKSKGRPVSQCNHCRSERKNRSAHVKCQCGKRASEGGSGKKQSPFAQETRHVLTSVFIMADCGCFSGQKCRCATKKSPKQEPAQLGDISETVPELASPASLLTMASPAQLSSTGSAADFQWSDAATTPASNFTSLDGLAQFDPNTWISSGPQLDTTTTAGLGSDGGSMAMSATGQESSELFSSPHQQQQQFLMDSADFTNVNAWPAMDDEATKQLLAMMDTSTGMDLNGFDASALGIIGSGDADSTFGLDFSSVEQQQPPQQTLPQPAMDNAKPACNSKQEKGCGPCCG